MDNTKIRNKIIKQSEERIKDLLEEIKEEKKNIREAKKQIFVKCPNCVDGNDYEYVGLSCGDDKYASPYRRVNCKTCQGKGYLIGK